MSKISSLSVGKPDELSKCDLIKTKFSSKY